jgi:hypothetical protein
MTYPALTRKNAVQIAEELLKEDIDQRVDTQIDHDKYVEEKQGQFDAKQLAADASAIHDKWNELTSKAGKVVDDDLVQFEIAIAPMVYSAIQKISLDCREDEDFWRYLALFPFRWYLIAREPELQPQDYGGLKEKSEISEDGEEVIKISNSSMIYQLIYRTYLIGKAIEDGSDSKEPFARANAIPRGGPLTDIWQSHIIRVTIGRIGFVRHAFIDRVKTEPVAKSQMLDFARSLASRLTRMRNNVVLDLHSKSEIDAVVKEISKQI